MSIINKNKLLRRGRDSRKGCGASGRKSAASIAVQQRNLASVVACRASLHNLLRRVLYAGRVDVVIHHLPISRDPTAAVEVAAVAAVPGAANVGIGVDR